MKNDDDIYEMLKSIRSELKWIYPILVLIGVSVAILAAK